MAFQITPVVHDTGRTVYCMVRNPAGQFLNGSFQWGTLTAPTWSDFAHELSETPAACGIYTASVSDSSFGQTAPGQHYTVLYFEQAGSTPEAGDTPLYFQAVRYRAQGCELDLPYLAGDISDIEQDVGAIKLKTDSLPSLVSIRAPNLEASAYELAQYTTPTLTFTVKDALGGAVDLSGKTLSMRVQYGWGGRVLFTKADGDFDKSQADDGVVSVTLTKSDSAWTGRITQDAPFQGELFDVTGGAEAELGRFVILLRPSHAEKP